MIDETCQHGLVTAEVLRRLRLHADRGLQGVLRVGQSLQGIGGHQTLARGAAIARRIELSELLLGSGQRETHPLGLGEQLVCRGERRLQLAQGTEVQGLEVLPLVLQHLGFVGELLNLVFNLLQRA